jgi:hypothetical protein
LVINGGDITSLVISSLPLHVQRSLAYPSSAIIASIFMAVKGPWPRGEESGAEAVLADQNDLTNVVTITH